MSNDPACSTFRKILVALVFGVGVFLIPCGAQSATSKSATLQWAANQEPDLAGYRVYHGTTPGNYGPSLNTGKTTTYQYDNLESNKTHYFSVTAYDSSGNESTPSLEANTFIQAAVPPPSSSLSVPLTGGGSGTVSSNPGGVSCSSGHNCAGTVPQGSQVTLNVAPSSGSTVSHLSPPPSSSLIVHPASLTQEEIKSQKKLAKAEELSAKIQKHLAKIETMLVRYAHKPKIMARLNKKKEKYSMVLAKIQEIHSIN